MADVSAGGGGALSSRARLRAGADLHREVQAAREEGVEAEVVLRHSVVVRGWTCTIHGRADLVAEEDGWTVVEELKSSLLPGDALARASGFLAWERQLALYVCFAAAARRPSPIGRLRVISLVDGAERVFTVPLDPTLEPWLLGRLDRLVREREERLAWIARRRGSPVHFAHDAVRPGQDEVVEAVVSAVHQEGHLLMVAPTGVGKTAAVLHGVLRATVDRPARVWWATARTTQQAMVERTAAQVRARGTPLRSVTIRAREKACRRLGVPCEPATCPLLAELDEARLDAALDALSVLGTPDADALGRVAAAHRMCPYVLAQAWLPRCDLVIADYNYVFEPSMRLRDALEDAPCVLVVEEAHQLPDRAMDWGSPSLDTALVAAAFAALPGDAVWDPFRTVARAVAEALSEAPLLATGEGDGETLIVEVNLRRWRQLGDAVDDLGIAHAALRGVEEAAPADAWTELARAVHRFVGALGRAGEETVALWKGGPTVLLGNREEFPGGCLALTCRDPSRVLAPVFADARATISISATLAPTWFYRDRCGLAPDRVSEHHAPSPFDPSRRLALVVAGVSTEFKHRTRDRARIVALVEEIVAAVPGNVAVFFGSFEQLDDVMGAVSTPGRELLRQTPSMDERARTELLDRMRDPSAPFPRVLAGVLGGVFAEGVDLPGEALRAVAVVGPALPPPTLERRLLQAWYQERFGAGFDLAYVHPGMTRVVQAAGRVVRRPEDFGAVILVCQRFLRNTYAAHLPAAWAPERARAPGARLRVFFDSWEDSGAFVPAVPGGMTDREG